MNITTDFKSVTPDPKLPFGSYEWWYFDGISDNGEWAYVIILYQQNPFSTRYIDQIEKGKKEASLHPAISVSLYKDQKPVYYSFLEYGPESFEWDQKEKAIRISDDRASYWINEEEIGFEVKLSQDLSSGHSIHGKIEGKGKVLSPQLLSGESTDQHYWNLLHPSLSVNADLNFKGKGGKQKAQFEGRGYMDHNVGREPMKESFQDWYWGRFHFEGKTLIYYLMQKKEERQFEGWLIDDHTQSVEQHISEARLEEYARNWFGLKSALKIELDSSQVVVNIQNANKIDEGPFYRRFISDCIMKYSDKIYAAQGITEYIKPSKIHDRRFWPLVHMRLRYMYEEAHWVQKSPFMYPWTW